MFQYAALRGIAAHHQVSYSLPSQTSLHQCFKIPRASNEIRTPQITETTYEFDETVFSCSEGDLYGFFQTEKYFSHIEKEIRQDFRFRDIIYDTCFHYRKHILSEEVIALHIRRGDYLTDSNFVILYLDYYMNALELLPNLEVLVLTDDVNWCRDNFTNKRFKISLSGNPFIDLCLMSLCEYHIIANSSFSWWGSWLAKSKKTIAPKQWFTGEYSDWNTKDLYRKDWIIL